MKGQKPGTYNVMRKFRIGEVSSVDHPAQGEGARMTIMKRDDRVDMIKRLNDYMVEKGWTSEHIDVSVERWDMKKKAALTDPMDGHAHLLHGIDDGNMGETTMSGEGEHYHSHPWIAGINGELIVGAANGHTHRVGFFSKADVLDETHFTQEQLSASSEQSDPADDTPTEENTMNETEFNEKIAEIQKQLDSVTADRDIALAVAAMNDVEKAHYAQLDGDAKSDFLKSETKSDEIAKANDADPVVGEFEGREIRKSDDPTGVITALLEKAKKDKEKSDKDEEDKKKFAFEAKKADLAKRAAELTNLPGDENVRIELLKAVDSIEDEDVRKSALAAIVAKNDELTSAFAEVGTVGNPEHASSDDKFAAMAVEIMKNDASLTPEQAYVQAMETDEGLEEFGKRQEAI